MTYHVERRAAPRIELSTRVRFLLRNEIEGHGQVSNISICGVALKSNVSVEIGDAIVLYAEELGRITGRVVRSFDGGFAVEFTITARQLETMQFRISAAANGMPYIIPPEKRSSVRVRYNIATRVTINERGESVRCVLVDLSVSGCRLKCRVKPRLGTPVVVGALKGNVKRHTRDGFAVDFVKSDHDGRSLKSHFTCDLETASEIRPTNIK